MLLTASIERREAGEGVLSAAAEEDTYAMMARVEQVRRVLRGPMVPVITAFKDDLGLDVEAVQGNVRLLIEGGVVR